MPPAPKLRLLKPKPVEDSGRRPRPVSQRTDEKSKEIRYRARRLASALQRSAASELSGRIENRDVASDVRGSQVRRTDGWHNAITRLGETLYDKRLAGMHDSDRMFDMEAEDLWRGDAMAARAVETIPEHIERAGWELLVQDDDAEAGPPTRKPSKKQKDALRWLRSDRGRSWLEGKLDGIEPGVRVKVEANIRADLASDVFPQPHAQEERASTKELVEGIEAQAKDLGAMGIITECIKAERAYGGAAIFPGINDGEPDLSKPLDYDKVRSIDWLDYLTPLELVPYQWYANPVKANYGKPELYWMQRISIGNIGATSRVPIHASRIITFPGIVVSRRQVREHWGWGDSILVRMRETLRDFQSAYQGSAILVTEFAQAVMSVDGISEAFANGNDDLLTKRAQALIQGLSISKVAIIDSKEKFERQQTPVTGLSDLLDRFARKLAADTHMPVTILMGESPAGLNASGDNEVRNFYDDISAYRDRKLDERLRLLYRLFWRAKEGPAKGVEPEKWSFKYGHLWQPTELEVAQARYANAQTDQIYQTIGVLLPEEIAKSRFGGDEYSAETQLDPEIRQIHDEQVQAEAEAQAAAMQAQLAAGADPAAAGDGKGPPPKGGGGGPGGPPAPGGGPPSPAPGKSSVVVVHHAAPRPVAARGATAKPAAGAARSPKPAKATDAEEDPDEDEDPEPTIEPDAPMTTAKRKKRRGVAREGQEVGPQIGGAGGDKAPKQPPTEAAYPMPEESAGRAPGPEIPVGSSQGPHHDVEWNEEDHPRDKDGKFGSGGGDAHATETASRSHYKSIVGMGKAERKAEIKKFVEAKTPVPKDPEAAWIGQDDHPDDETWGKYMEGKPGSVDAVTKDPVRAELHQAIKDNANEGVTPVSADQQPVAIFNMGAAASGKGNMNRKFNDKNIVVIDPDLIKGKLPEYRDGVSSKLMSAAANVHEESSTVAKQMRDTAISERKNFLFDGTGRDAGKYAEAMNAARAAGYRVELRAAYKEKEKARIYQDKRANKSGRWVPTKAFDDGHANIPKNFAKLSKAADRSSMWYQRPGDKEVTNMWSFGSRGGRGENQHERAFIRSYKQKYQQIDSGDDVFEVESEPWTGD